MVTRNSSARAASVLIVDPSVSEETAPFLSSFILSAADIDPAAEVVAALIVRVRFPLNAPPPERGPVVLTVRVVGTLAARSVVRLVTLDCAMFESVLLLASIVLFVRV